MKKSSEEHLEAIRSRLRAMGGGEGKSAEQLRAGLAAASKLFPTPPVDAAIEKTRIGRLEGEWVRSGSFPDEASTEKTAILYFHGGGFVAGSCEFYRDLAVRLASASGVPVLTIEYRLAPEHRYPAANEDCLHAYLQLLEAGFAPDRIVLGGDSAGASLALMTLLALRDEGAPRPAGAFLLSPHADLVRLDGDSYRSRAGLDPTGSERASREMLEAYLGGPPQGDLPLLLSPLRMELTGLPPLLIQVGGHEVLLSDAVRLAERAAAAGGTVTLEVWERLWSAFQTMAFALPEARQAIRNIGRFVRAILKE